MSFDGTDVNNYRMDELSEGDMLSSNFWGRLSDTAVPSIVDDVKGFESRARRVQMRIADTSGLPPPWAAGRMKRARG